MRRISYRPYVLFCLFLFCLLNLPQRATQKMRAFVVASLAPSWEGVHLFKEGTRKLLAAIPTTAGSSSAQSRAEIEKLQQENHRLRCQIESVREWLFSEERIKEQMERIRSMSSDKDPDPAWKEFFKRRMQTLAFSLIAETQSLYAKVIFREPSSWSSSLWLNVGQRDNERLGKTIVAKNSPVVLGTAIVGVVEYVGPKQCRVRLLSDSGLHPSVRACRGSEQNHFLLEHLDVLIQNLAYRRDLFASAEEGEAFLLSLGNFKKRLGATNKDYYLAKGELRGSSAAHFRSKSQTLVGRGFNYDFSDSEGPARDLRTGSPLDGSKKDALPLLQVGDLLVTTGMDGVLPAGFKVAIVTKVGRLREGACAYELEAKAAAGNLDELTHLFVLPPLEFDRPSPSHLL